VSSPLQWMQCQIHLHVYTELHGIHLIFLYFVVYNVGCLSVDKSISYCQWSAAPQLFRKAYRFQWSLNEEFQSKVNVWLQGGLGRRHLSRLSFEQGCPSFVNWKPCNHDNISCIFNSVLNYFLKCFFLKIYLNYFFYFIKFICDVSTI
jgi:hypothetical protein